MKNKKQEKKFMEHSIACNTNKNYDEILSSTNSSDQSYRDCSDESTETDNINIGRNNINTINNANINGNIHTNGNIIVNTNINTDENINTDTINMNINSNKKIPILPKNYISNKIQFDTKTILNTEDILRNVTNISQNRLETYPLNIKALNTENYSDEYSCDDNENSDDENEQNTSSTHDKKKFYVRNFITLQRDQITSIQYSSPSTIVSVFYTVINEQEYFIDNTITNDQLCKNICTRIYTLQYHLSSTQLCTTYQSTIGWGQLSSNIWYPCTILETKTIPQDNLCSLYKFCNTFYPPNIEHYQEEQCSMNQKDNINTNIKIRNQKSSSRRRQSNNNELLSCTNKEDEYVFDNIFIPFSRFYNLRSDIPLSKKNNDQLNSTNKLSSNLCGYTIDKYLENHFQITSHFRTKSCVIGYLLKNGKAKYHHRWQLRWRRQKNICYYKSELLESLNSSKSIWQQIPTTENIQNSINEINPPIVQHAQQYIYNVFIEKYNCNHGDIQNIKVDNPHIDKKKAINTMQLLSQICQQKQWLSTNIKKQQALNTNSNNNTSDIINKKQTQEITDQYVHFQGQQNIFNTWQRSWEFLTPADMDVQFCIYLCDITQYIMYYCTDMSIHKYHPPPLPSATSSPMTVASSPQSSSISLTSPPILLPSGHIIILPPLSPFSMYYSQAVVRGHTYQQLPPHNQLQQYKVPGTVINVHNSQDILLRQKHCSIGQIKSLEPQQLYQYMTDITTLKSTQNDKNSIKNTQLQTKSRHTYIIVDNYISEVWYKSSYPEEVQKYPVQYICQYCFQYFIKRSDLNQHEINGCHYSTHKPGTRIYYDSETNLSVYQVNGNSEKFFCQCICLLTTVFIDNKTVCYAVDSQVLYVLYAPKQDNVRKQVPVGFFSKEHNNTDNHNQNCILTFPFYQRKGYGSFLIELSYQQSRREKVPGTPERPFSELGRQAYHTVWVRIQIRTIQQQQLESSEEALSIPQLSSSPNQPIQTQLSIVEKNFNIKYPLDISVSVQSQRTGMLEVDCLSAQQHYGFLRTVDNKFVFTVRLSQLVDQLMQLYSHRSQYDTIPKEELLQYPVL